MDYPKFQITKGGDGQFYFHLFAENARNILDSEAYTTKASCSHGIESVKENSAHDDRFDRKTADNGEFYFVLVAGNGEAIGKSEMYSTAQARDKGIASVQNNAPAAGIEDLS